MRNRQEERQNIIHEKGFNLFHSQPVEYGSLRLINRTVEDATLNVGVINRVHRQFGDKHFVLKAIMERDYPLLREISDFYYRTNGIYQRACDYFAFMYRFDWYVVPEIYEEPTAASEKKILTNFNKILTYLDNSEIKRYCGQVALSVIKYGVYYGLIIPSKNQLVVQELPPAYCRTVMNSGNMPVVEFSMRFFDECFKDVNTRMKILQLFPKDVQKGYVLYKERKLSQPDKQVDPTSLFPSTERTRFWDQIKWNDGSWFVLDPASTVKFTMGNNAEQPFFINAIPAILDLDAAQDLDRKREMQKLLKILVQIAPRDKNGDLIFDVDEVRDLHENAREMLAGTIGVQPFTTPTDVKVEKIADDTNTTSTDALQRFERAVFNTMGISRNLFNTETNLALEKSILNDEATVKQLVLQINSFFDRVVQSLTPQNNKYNFRLYMLETTQYNYKELSKMYKEQVQMGYSKILPQIALGHSQSSIIHTAYFENEVLDLAQIMIPPMLSSTMNAETILDKGNQKKSSNSQNKTDEGESSTVKVSKTTLQTEKGDAGRPEKPDSEKSDKTIANKESM